MKRKITIIFIWLSINFSLVSCKKLVEVDGPTTSVNSGNIYEKDVTAASVLTGIYTNLSASSVQSLTLQGISYFSGLSSDELALLPNLGSNEMRAYYSNSLNSQIAEYGFWNNIYNQLFVINSAIEGVSNSSTLTPAVKQQLLGEAKFMRAFCFFYLVNLYGDAPLTLGTDYMVNSVMPRTPVSRVWTQIIEDLKDAQKLLSPDYLDASLIKITTQRLRPTKYAATALLARAFLYDKNWKQAEQQSSAVIENSQYDLVDLNGVFLMNSKEAIWQLQPVSLYPNTLEGVAFICDPNRLDATPAVLSNSLMSSFDAGDQRKVSWTKSFNSSGQEYSYAYKYKKGMDPSLPTTEYSTILRVAEQYLIRAEARIQLNQTVKGIEDLNLLRDRATEKTEIHNRQLKALSLSLSKEEALLAVEHERQVELFTEWGHRWLDIKRTNRVDQIMSANLPEKVINGHWKSYQQLYPIGFFELQNGPKLTQNKGY